MDFIDIIKQFSSRAAKMKDQIQTEEATKTSLIMPFFQQVLGYDVFNPDEFVPEFNADVGIKKGEKVDYAIFLDGEPTILVEAKWCGTLLDKHDSQLFRYFGTTKAKFAILTNGIIYKFYTDLEESNKMDLKPFLEFDLLDIKEPAVNEIKRFCKSNFDVEEIFGSASELKYSNEIKNFFAGQLDNPDDDFVRFVLSHTYDGVKTQAVIDKFRPLIKKTLNNYINELMNDKITSALKGANTKAPEESVATPEESPVEDAPKPKIVTTEEEMQAYYIIKAIIAEKWDIDKVSYTDTTNYFAINYAAKGNPWICRVKLGSGKRYLAFQVEPRKEERFDIETVNDLYKFRKKILSVVDAIEGEQ